MKRLFEKRHASDVVLDVWHYGFIALFSVLCIVPFVLVLSASFTDESTLEKFGYALWPAKFSTFAYQTMLRTSEIPNAYEVTIFTTVVGTFLSLVITAAMAYPLSQKTVKYRNQISFFVFFTMLFNGGLVPSYILIDHYLNLKDNIWVLIIPILMNTWNMFLMRNFFASIPESFAESARLDGANDIQILIRIILPISLPAFATIGLFYGLEYWNQWYNCMLYISNSKLYTLQYLLMSIMNQIDYMNQLAAQAVSTGTTYIPPTYAARMATTILTIGPIIFLYPFVQKYFVKGLMVGGIKG